MPGPGKPETVISNFSRLRAPGMDLLAAYRCIGTSLVVIKVMAGDQRWLGGDGRDSLSEEIENGECRYRTALGLGHASR